ncbi:MAG TPA: hypothetical protein VFW47_04340 [Phenylobacterium sp.]|nr:hypothetical protein [Phenylobacterium sp.]
MAGLTKDKSKDRAFSHGSGGAAADSAVEGRAKLEDRYVETPHARKAKHPLEEGKKPDQLAAKALEAEDRQEALLDEGLEESFPSSDPVSVKRIT